MVRVGTSNSLRLVRSLSLSLVSQDTAAADRIDVPQARLISIRPCAYLFPTKSLFPPLFRARVFTPKRDFLLWDACEKALQLLLRDKTDREMRKKCILGEREKMHRPRGVTGRSLHRFT